MQVQIRCPIDASADDSLKLNRMSCIMHADADVFSYNADDSLKLNRMCFPLEVCTFVVLPYFQPGPQALFLILLALWVPLDHVPTLG